MGMLKANEVTPRNVKNILPGICKSRIYVEPAEGMEFTITGAAINVFPAKGENGEALTTQTGETIMRRVAYVLVGDEIYTSVKGWTAIEQIISLNPAELDKMEEGTYECTGFAQKVKTIIVKEKMGKKEFDYIAFEPLE